MNNFIRVKAENIWGILHEKGEMSLRQIGEHTYCTDSIIFIAIGWLLKEGKICIGDKGGTLYFRPKESNITEIYY